MPDAHAAASTGADYEFETTEQRRSNGTTANQEAVIPGFAAATPIAILQPDHAAHRHTASTCRPALPTAMAGAGHQCGGGAVGPLQRRSVFPMGIQPALGNNNSIEEERHRRLTCQADWDTDLAGARFRGNVGVR